MKPATLTLTVITAVGVIVVGQALITTVGEPSVLPLLLVGVLVAVMAVHLLRRWRSVRLEASVASARPGAALVVGQLAPRAAHTLRTLDLPQRAAAPVVLAATDQGVELWTQPPRPLVHRPWQDVDLAAGATQLGIRQPAAVVVQLDAVHRIPVILARGLSLWQSEPATERAVQRLTAMRAAA